MNDHSLISVRVKFFATLREFGPKTADIELPYGSSIQTVLDRYKIPKEARQLILLVNGTPHKTQDTTINDGDVIAIFPPIGGG